MLEDKNNIMNLGKSESDRVKIKMFDTHFAWIAKSLIEEFDNKVGKRNRIEQIKIWAKEDFYIELNEKEDLVKLDMLLRLKHYEDKADWLKERLRGFLNNARKEEKLLIEAKIIFTNSLACIIDQHNIIIRDESEITNKLIEYLKSNNIILNMGDTIKIERI